MPLETTFICLDTSEYMRNGDYTPTRLGAQYDAVTVLINSKVLQHPENTVGVLAFGGKTTKLLTSPTEDIGKLLAVLTDLRPEGDSGFVAGFKTAVMALRHRKNKNGGQRIVLFVGSPTVDGTEAEYQALGALARKNGVAVDIVAMGENDENTSRLSALVTAANKEGNSHFLSVPAGVLPSDMLSSHPIMHGESAGGGAGPAAGGAQRANFNDFGGIDPSLDPELALAMQMSLAEARSSAQASDAPAAPDAAPARAADVDEDALLQQALAMSMQVENSVPTPASAPSPAPAASPSTAPVAAAPATAGTAEPAAAPASGEGFTDPSFIASVLGNLEGVDMSDPVLRAAIEAISNPSGTTQQPPNNGQQPPKPDGGAGSSK